LEEIRMIEGTGAATRDIVQKLWSLCNVLRDDGITYQDYVTELTFLLFLKMMQETKREDALPKEYRWGDLTKREGEDLLTHYRALLLKLGTESKGMVRDIFTDAQTSLRRPTNLKTLVSEIDKLDWFSARREGLGDLYEGLLQKNAGEKKSGAGQYFTPRPLIDCLVRLLKPKPGEIVQDPAAGTGGFLVASDRFIKDATDDLFNLSPEQQHFQRTQAFVGLELVLDAHPRRHDCLLDLSRIADRTADEPPLDLTVVGRRVRKPALECVPLVARQRVADHSEPRIAWRGCAIGPIISNRRPSRGKRIFAPAAVTSARSISDLPPFLVKA
jgi:N-6 DNA Methylase/HsdM N-terminal domain